jgi:hypothetical protein
VPAERLEEVPVIIIIDSGPVRVVDDGVDSSDDESFRDAGYVPSSSSGEESADGEVIAISNTRKRKIQRAFED